MDGRQFMTQCFSSVAIHSLFEQGGETAGFCFKTNIHSFSLIFSFFTFSEIKPPSTAQSLWLFLWLRLLRACGLRVSWKTIASMWISLARFSIFHFWSFKTFIWKAEDGFITGSVSWARTTDAELLTGKLNVICTAIASCISKHVLKACAFSWN